MKVLLVDDSAPDRSILRYIFRAQEYETIEAENGQEGLAQAAEHKPDLIVSDALMPVMDGFAFLRAIKADRVLREIPFIFYSAVYIGHNEEALARSLGAEAFLVKPLEPTTLWQEVQELLSRHGAKKAGSMPITQGEEEHFLRKYNQVVVAKLEEKVTELEKLLIRVVRVLVNLLDAKSPWTVGHSERVAAIAVKIAREMGLDENKVNTIHLGALLHDIGKIGTSDALLDKLTALTDDEYLAVQVHPDRGADALAAIDQLKDVIPLIRHHHENFDGTGYPQQLGSDAIPLAARILCVADAYDSMTANRPYRSAPGYAYAVAELKRCAGRQFDPAVVEVFFKVLACQSAPKKELATE